MTEMLRRPVRFIGPGNEQFWCDIVPELYVVYLTRQYPPARFDQHFAAAGPFTTRGVERVYRREWRHEPYGPLCTPVPSVNGHIDVVFRLDSEREIR